MKIRLENCSIIQVFCITVLIFLTINAHSQTITINLDNWLSDHPEIRNGIVWINENRAISYTNWSSSMHTELQDAVNGYLNYQYPFELTGVPNVTEHGTDVYGVSETTAWIYYISYVAQSIAADIIRLVPWGLDELNATSLKVLFDSREMLLYSSFYNTYQFKYVTPAPPDNVYKFLENNALIGQTRVETISRVVEWCKRLVHYGNTGGVDNLFYDHWQYYGSPPVIRIIEGTVRSSSNTFGHWTAGCHGTVGLIRTLLQTLNIPTQYLNVDGHAQPHFTHENLYLSHGDDPYNALIKCNDYRIPANELLIGETEYQSHFGSHLSHEERLSNIAYKSKVLGVEYISMPFCYIRCEANSQGYNDQQCYELMHEYSGLADVYTMQQLNDLDFWNRLDNKINSYGGCNNNNGFYNYCSYNPLPESDHEIFNLWFYGQVGSSIVNQNMNTITAQLGADYELDQIIPHFCISEKAENSYLSGSIVDFSNPQYFIIRAENDSTKQWRVEISQSGQINITTPTSITAISVFPNPTYNSFVLKITNSSKNEAIIRVLNSKGVKVREIEVDDITYDYQLEIPASNLKEGIYIVQVLINYEELHLTKVVILK